MVYSVQVKRLRNEDPIDALLVRDAKRKRDVADEERSLVFRLARTYDEQQAEKHIILEGSSKNVSGADTENVFAIAQNKRLRLDAKGGSGEPGAINTDAHPPTEDTELVPAELQSMIAEYMSTENRQQVSPTPEESDKETEDYVYDVYFSGKAGPAASGSIGYIDVDENQKKLLFGDINSDSESSFVGEEDDSNAEDYYKNEYPEEEDEEGGEFGSDLDDILGDKLGDLRLDPEWSEEDEADDGTEASFNRYGWR